MIRQTRLALLIPLLSGSTSALLSSTAATRGITSSLILLSTANADNMDHYRKDGVRITHDPYAPGMAEMVKLTLRDLIRTLTQSDQESMAAV